MKGLTSVSQEVPLLATEDSRNNKFSFCFNLIYFEVFMGHPGGYNRETLDNVYLS